MATLQNQLMSISELDERIGFVTVTETVDDFGFTKSDDSTPTATIPAKVRFERTNEGDEGQQEKFVQEIKVWIRYYTAATEYKQLYWRSKKYDIYAIEDTPRSRFMILKCRLIET